MGTLIGEESVGDRHTELPDLPQYPMSMSQIKRRGGPWKCPNDNCGPSYWSVRCTICGIDLA